VAQNLLAMLTAIPAGDLILFCVLLISVYTDIKKGLIYNTVLMPAAITALILQFARDGASGIIFSLQGLLVGMSLLMIPFIKSGIGAGDVKLLGVVGAYKGSLFAVKAFLAAAMAGGIMAIFILLRNRNLIFTLKAICINTCSFLTRMPRHEFFGTLKSTDCGSKFSYGPMIALGTLIAYFGL